MPDALPLTGLFGKVPAHGDFVRRGLPTSFVAPWDSWLQRGMEAARDRLGTRWAESWDSAPPWRFALPAGACGPDAVAGVMLPSQDMVGRRFPITLAALLAPGASVPVPAWFAALEAAALAGRDGRADADALAAAIPHPDADPVEAHHVESPVEPTDSRPVSNLPDPLEMFGRAGTSTTTEASTSFLPGAAEGPGPAIDPSAEGMNAAPGLLDIFSAAAPEPASSQILDDQDVLAIFAGAAPPAALPAQVAPPPGDGRDTLGALSPPPSMATPPAPDPAPSDGTLAFLLGEGVPPVPDGAAAPEATPDEAGQADPLAALIAAGEVPLRDVAPDDDALLPSASDPRPIPTDMAPMVSAAPASALLSPADAPPPPPGGGWWTGGGGRLPPSIRSSPALLPAYDFACLLEADA